MEKVQGGQEEEQGRRRREERERVWGVGGGNGIANGKKEER